MAIDYYGNNITASIVSVTDPNGETVAITELDDGFAFTVTENGVYTLKFTAGAEELDEYALNIVSASFLLNFEGDALDNLRYGY